MENPHIEYKTGFWVNFVGFPIPQNSLAICYIKTVVETGNIGCLTFATTP